MMNHMKGKICMITGANSGIGKVTALELAKMGVTLIIVVRNPKKGEEALTEIKKLSGNDSIDLMIADFSSQKSIRNFVKEFKQKYQTLDILVNNAGIISGQRSETEDGLESTFAINHLGYFLLTVLLLDVLKNSAPSRIVNVSSDGHKGVELDFDDLQNKKNYEPIKVYRLSKLANVYFTYELAKKLEGMGVTINSLSPGMTRTNLASTDFSWFMRIVSKLFFLIAQRPEKAAKTSIYLASSPEVEGITGKYFIKKKETKSSPISYDETITNKLWEISENLVGLVESEKNY